MCVCVCVCVCVHERVCIYCVYLFPVFLSMLVLLPLDGEIKMYIFINSVIKSADSIIFDIQHSEEI